MLAIERQDHPDVGTSGRLCNNQVVHLPAGDTQCQSILQQRPVAIGAQGDDMSVFDKVDFYDPSCVR